MGLIRKSDRTNDAATGNTVVGAGSYINGELTLEDDLHVDGRIEGTIESRANVAVGNEGRLEGQIKADHLVVCGHVKGQVECSRLEILANGEVEGEVLIDELVIESGGRFSGESRIRDQANVHSLTHEPSALEHDKESGSGKRPSGNNNKKAETAGDT